MSVVMPSAIRMLVIAVNTFRESARQRFFVIMALTAALLCVAAWWLRDCSLVASREKFVLDAGFGALTFFGAVVAIVATAESFSGEIEKRTVLAVLSRPVKRGEFVLGKLGGILGLLLAFCIAGAGLLVAMLWWSKTAGAGAPAGTIVEKEHVSFLAVMTCGLVQWLRCSVLAALTLMVSTYSRSSLLAVSAGFAALVVCSLRTLALEASRSAASAWMEGVAGVVGFIVPDFDLYEVADGVADGGALSIGYISAITLYSGFYVSIFSAMAAYCFRHREL
jgi:ABC-type transport system involved in multi-copper enzyme maturation permease subunit